MTRKKALIAGATGVVGRNLLKHLLATGEWDIVAVYGNAQSDIDAYADAGIPLETTFIIGPLAGGGGTQPIDGGDYTDHIASFVDGEPDL